MIHIENYIAELISALRLQFGSGLLYVGLQGSYLRGEANEESDLDIMVVLEELTVSDLDRYRGILQSLEHYEKSCGFICSRADLAHWNPLEICSLLHGTKDCYGELRRLVPSYTEQDVRNFAKLSLNNLYHELCHRYLHAGPEENAEKLPGTYKGVFFILQSLYYLRHGVYIATKAELLPLLEGKDRSVLAHSMEYGSCEVCAFAESFSLLLTWCQETLQSIQH